MPPKDTAATPTDSAATASADLAPTPAAASDSVAPQAAATTQADPSPVQKVETPPAPKVEAAINRFEMSLTEFCSAHSNELKSPEMLSAFHTAETAAGNVLATADTFIQRLRKFTQKVV